jgi:hypothetical protein
MTTPLQHLEDIPSTGATEVVSVDEARRLTERIRLTALTVREGIEKLQALVERARAGHVHETLGYPSWTAYLADTLGGHVPDRQGASLLRRGLTAPAVHHDTHHDRSPEMPKITLARRIATAARKARFAGLRERAFTLPDGHRARQSAHIAAQAGTGRERAALLFADIPTPTVVPIAAGEGVRPQGTRSRRKAERRAAAAQRHARQIA